MAFGVGEAIVAACAWAFVEAALTYLTGTAPFEDLMLIVASPLVVLAFVATLTHSMRLLRPAAFLDRAQAATLFLPSLVYLGRTADRLDPAFLAAHAAAIAGLIPVVRAACEPKNGSFWKPSRIVLVVVSYFLSAFLDTLRVDRTASLTAAQAGVAFGACFAAAVLAFGAAALTRGRRSGRVIAMILLSLSTAIAWTERSRAPELKLSASVRAERPDARSPSTILLIVLDTVRADRLDLYGHTRPTFARTSAILREGLVFDHAVSAGTFSLTSHASLFTGRLASFHGAHLTLDSASPYGRLWRDVETAATWLGKRGYATAGLSANNVFLEPWTGLDEGFEAYSAVGRRNLTFTPVPTSLSRTLSRARLMNRAVRSITWSAEEITDAAIRLTDATRAPLFLFLNYFDAHDPHLIPEPPPWRERATAPLDVYDAEIAYLDRHVFRLLDHLRTRGRLDDTLVILTADHGEYFGERGLRGHPAEAYETSVHVPLALRFPRAIPAGRASRTTGGAEVLEMIRDVVEGRPMDRWRSEDGEPRVLTEAWSRQDYDGSVPADRRPSTTVVYAGRFKLIHRVSGRSELFDLASDPREENNLFASEDEQLVSLRERMVRTVHMRPIRPPGPAQALSEDARERLRALGYLR